MTIQTAISAKIEPYSVSDEALELGFIESSEYLGVSASVSDDYIPSAHLKAVALAAMKILSNLRSLSSENIGGLSNSYNTAKIDSMIRAIAKIAGLSPSLVGVEADGDMVIKCVRVW